MNSRHDELPSFMIIGAVKAATTWISEQLRAHPALWLPKAEPHFFSTEYHRGLNWYRAQFAEAPAGRMIGEKSADYLAHPDAAARIAEQLPGIPLIVQLRDPVKRAYSDYCMLYRRGTVGGDPRRYLDAAQSNYPRFLEGGRYAKHLRRLLEHVPANTVKIILYEDIEQNADTIVEEVCHHIGVATFVAEDSIPERRNDSSAPMLPLPLRRILGPARPLLDPLRSNSLLASMRAAMARPVRYPSLTEELKSMLREYYRADIIALQDLIKRDLSSWLQDDRVPA